MRNLYNVLGVAYDADLAEIHAAYRRRAKQAHPDLSSDHLNVHLDMVEINLAWEVLSDPQRRAEYDCHHAQRQPRHGHAHEPTARPTSHTEDRPPWEAAVPAGFVAYPRPHKWLADGLTRVLCAEGNRLHQGLSLAAMSIDLSGLDALAPSGVWWLDASDLALPPEQFDHIAKMTGLWRLNLSGSWLTDRTVSCLRHLDALRNLDVSGTAITDAAVPIIASLSSLTCLDLSHTGITDAGLVRLTELRQLGDLSVVGTAVTAEALVRLVTQLPHLRRLTARPAHAHRMRSHLHHIAPDLDVGSSSARK